MLCESNCLWHNNLNFSNIHQEAPISYPVHVYIVLNMLHALEYTRNPMQR